MMSKLFHLFAMLAFFVPCYQAEAKIRHHHSAYLTNDPNEQSLGTNARGRLHHAARLPDEGPGFVKIFRGKDAGFGTNDLIAIIEKAALEMQTLFPDGERIQIGDMSRRFGGRLSRHASHRRGLDADMSYFRVDHNEDFKYEKFVIDGEISSNFDIERNWELMKTLRRMGRVNRIFVDATIKREFCIYAEQLNEIDSESETLRLIRPLRRHDNHLHLRIACPEGTKLCVAQRPVTDEGTGCDRYVEEMISPDEAE